MRRENRWITGADGSNTVLKASRRDSGTGTGRGGASFRLIPHAGRQPRQDVKGDRLVQAGCRGSLSSAHRHRDELPPPQCLVDRRPASQRGALCPPGRADRQGGSCGSSWRSQRRGGDREVPAFHRTAECGAPRGCARVTFVRVAAAMAGKGNVARAKALLRQLQSDVPALAHLTLQPSGQPDRNPAAVHGQQYLALPLRTVMH